MPQVNITRRETFPGHWKYILRVRVNGRWQRVGRQFNKYIDAEEFYCLVYGHYEYSNVA